MAWTTLRRLITGKDGSHDPSSAEPLRSDAQVLVKCYLKQTGPGLVPSLSIDPIDCEAGERILSSPRELQAHVVLIAADQLVASIRKLQRRRIVSYGSSLYQAVVALKPLLSALLRRNLTFTETQVEAVVETAAGASEIDTMHFPIRGVVRLVEKYAAEHGVSNPLRERLLALQRALRRHSSNSEDRKVLRRVQCLTERSNQAVKLTTSEPWTRPFQAVQAEKTRPDWNELLAHCATATSTKASKRWLRQAERLIDVVGRDEFVSIVACSLAEIGKSGVPEVRTVTGRQYLVDPTIIHDTHSDLLRGLVWCASLVKDERLIGAVGNAAEVCFKKIPGHGPRSPKIGNACLYGLSRMGEMSAVAQLSRLKTRVKHASVRAQLAKALDAAAELAGMSQADLEETVVPTFGMTEIGEYREQFGEVTAHLRVADSSKTELRWIKPDGRTQKSVPAAVKEQFPEPLKALKQTAKEIEKMLPAQRDRIEQLYLQQRSWSLRDFRSRYLDHPLVGSIARRLIWHFENDDKAADGIWHNGALVDSNGDTLNWLTDETRVELWHPIGHTVDQVAAWRDWLERHEVRQPFKQAHREVYILTDAERQTETYSNRFASHIIRQHQFSALCQQRGWRYTLQGDFDSHNTPYVEIPPWEMRAEFWVDPAGGGEGNLSASFIYLYLATDQVRFHRMHDQGPLSLADVPPLVFSEVMRDVDLFVGVASVGNDPNWSDGGPDGRYYDYWHDYTFGDLSATARTRREVLERLVPRLKIAARCSLTDKFLVVRGELRSYKIHLGSGNVLMTPNDQYLCIVPARGVAARGSDGVFLPFEGDNTLSIILSKAFLLAEDTKIKDRTILSQIRR